MVQKFQTNMHGLIMKDIKQWNFSYCTCKWPHQIIVIASSFRSQINSMIVVRMCTHDTGDTQCMVEYPRLVSGTTTILYFVGIWINCTTAPTLPPLSWLHICWFGCQATEYKYFYFVNATQQEDSPTSHLPSSTKQWTISLCPYKQEICRGVWLYLSLTSVCSVTTNLIRCWNQTFTTTVWLPSYQKGTNYLRRKWYETISVQPFITSPHD